MYSWSLRQQGKKDTAGKNTWENNNQHIQNFGEGYKFLDSSSANSKQDDQM